MKKNETHQPAQNKKISEEGRPGTPPLVTGPTEADIKKATALAAAAANLSPEEALLIAKPDSQQQKILQDYKKKHGAGNNPHWISPHEVEEKMKSDLKNVKKSFSRFHDNWMGGIEKKKVELKNNLKNLGIGDRNNQDPDGAAVDATMSDATGSPEVDDTLATSKNDSGKPDTNHSFEDKKEATVAPPKTLPRVVETPHFKEETSLPLVPSNSKSPKNNIVTSDFAVPKSGTDITEAPQSKQEELQSDSQPSADAILETSPDKETSLTRSAFSDISDNGNEDNRTPYPRPPKQKTEPPQATSKQPLFFNPMTGTKITNNKISKALNLKSSSPVPPLSELPPITLQNVVWKKRSGLGKYSSRDWERRKLELRGSVLLYYALEDELPEKEDGKQVTPEDKDMNDRQAKPSIWEQTMSSLQTTPFNFSTSSSSTIASPQTTTPRGFIDLVKEPFSVATSSGHHSRPTPFIIDLIGKSETVWKICFDDLHTWKMWNKELTYILVRQSVMEFDGPGDYTMEEREANNDRGIEISKEIDLNASAKVSTKGKVERVVVIHNGYRFQADGQQVFVVWGLMNAVLIYCRSSASPLRFWHIFTFVNGLFWYTLKDKFREEIIYYQDQQKPEQLPITQEEKKIHSTEEAKLLPLAGSSTTQIELDNLSPSHEKISWKISSSSVMQVRSHNYLTSKKKIPSPISLYEIVGVDIIQSDGRIPDIATRVQLPPNFYPDNFSKEDKPYPWYCPPIFVVSAAIPTEAPKLTRPTEEGQGIMLVMYFRMRPETFAILQHIHDGTLVEDQSDTETSVVNAVKLFDEWCRRSPQDPKFQARFKLVPNAANLASIGLPAYISKYANKPMLIKRSDTTGFFRRHSKEVLEFGISLHPFPYVAKQAFAYMKDNFFKKFILNLGFVIEGRSEEELPEVMLGCGQLCHPDPGRALWEKAFFDVGKGEDIGE